MTTIDTEQATKIGSNYRKHDIRKDKDINVLTFTSKVTLISKKHQTARTTIPTAIMRAMGVDVGDVIYWTVNKIDKTITLNVKKAVATY